MSVADERLEILIGKLLDGEITPAERRLLESELERNAEAKELLEQFKSLDESSRAAVARDVVEAGANPEEVFQRAWQQSEQSPWRRIAKADGHLRFAAGLAAGFVLGVLLHIVLVWGERPAIEPSPPLVARDPSGDGRDSPGNALLPASDVAQRSTREVDWFVFTDAAGGRWVVEGVREGMVRNAAYQGGL